MVDFPLKSSILIGFSIINHPFWGYLYFWKHPDTLPETSSSHLKMDGFGRRSSPFGPPPFSAANVLSGGGGFYGIWDPFFKKHLIQPSITTLTGSGNIPKYGFFSCVFFRILVGWEAQRWEGEVFHLIRVDFVGWRIWDGVSSTWIMALLKHVLTLRLATCLESSSMEHF